MCPKNSRMRGKSKTFHMSSTKKAQQLSWMQYCNWFIFREDCEISHHQEGLRLARRGHRRWLTVFYISDKKKTRRVQCQRCYTCVGVCWEVCSGQPYQRQPKDPRVSEEKHCQSQAQEGCHLLFWERLFSAMMRAVSGLRRTDELVFSEIRKQQP